MFHAEVTTRAKTVNFDVDEEVMWLSICCKESDTTEAT